MINVTSNVCNYRPVFDSLKRGLSTCQNIARHAIKLYKLNIYNPFQYIVTFFCFKYIPIKFMMTQWKRLCWLTLFVFFFVRFYTFLLLIFWRHYYFIIPIGRGLGPCYCNIDEMKLNVTKKKKTIPTFGMTFPFGSPVAN